MRIITGTNPYQTVLAGDEKLRDATPMASPGATTAIVKIPAFRTPITSPRANEPMSRTMASPAVEASIALK